MRWRIKSTPRNISQASYISLSALEGRSIKFCNPGSHYLEVSADLNREIIQYVQLTIRHYVFMNILLALGGPGIFEGDAVRKMACFPTGDDMFPILHYLDDQLPGILNDVHETNMLYQDFDWFSSGDPLHNSFWNLRETQDERLETIEGARNSYLERSFDIITSFYAFLRTIQETEVAINMRHIHTGIQPIFILLTTIITAFSSFDDAFLVKYETAECSQHHHSNDTAETAIALPNPNPSIVRGRSLYLELPLDAILLIHASLPFDSLLSLYKVCRRLKELCAESIYAYALSLAITPTWSLSVPTELRPNREHLCTLLESRDDLRQHIRYVPLFYNHRLTIDDEPPTPELSSLYCYDGIPLLHPLSSLLPNMREVKLKLYFPREWFPMRDRVVQATLLLLHERAPSIQSLDLEIQSCSQDLRDGLPSKEVVEMISRSRESVPPSWGLQRFALTLDLDGGTDTSFFPVRPLLSSSASTLRFLSLTFCKGDLGHLTNLPYFINVCKLALCTDLEPYAIETILSHFPTVVDLEVGKSGHIPCDFMDLDFSKYAPTTQYLIVADYRIFRLSPSIQTLSVNTRRGVFSAVSQHPSNELKALRLNTWNLWRPTSDVLEVISQMAISYPNLLSFEICDYRPWGDELDQGIVGQETVTEIANHTLDVWPLLETLVLSVRGFRYRPRRRDFPNIDDGLDAELKHLALAMFMRHSALNIVAMTAIPPKVENPYTIPRRVWKREGDDAIMVGRDAIQWKFDTGRYPKYYA